MELHPLAHGFGDVAQEYELGRPGYPPAAVAALRAGLALSDGARIADVGAGTGKLTRALVAGGLEAVAVEPFAAMRAALAAAVPGVEVLDGTAEALPLDDASVDAVACGDAFHWFDGERAAPELARVIRPGGGLALLWNAAAHPGASQPWSPELVALLQEVRPEHPGFTGEQGREAIDASPDFGPFTRVDVEHEVRSTRAMLLASIASFSYVAVMPADERAALLARVDALLADQGLDTVDVPLRTAVWMARRR